MFKISKQYYNVLDMAYKGKDGQKRTLSSFVVSGIGGTTLIEGKDFQIITLNKEVRPCMPANDLRYRFLTRLDEAFSLRKFKANNIRFLADESGKNLSFELTSQNDRDLVHATICSCAGHLLFNDEFKLKLEVVEVAKSYCFLEKESL